MRTHFVFLLVLFLLICSGLFVVAQDNVVAAYPKNIIKTNPFSDITGGLNLSYERMMTDYGGLNVSLKGNFIAPFSGIITNTDYFGIIIQEKPTFRRIATNVAYRFYSKKKAGPRGFYAQPYLSYDYFNFSVNTDYTGDIYGTNKTVNADVALNVHRVGAGVQLGAQWLIKDKISIDWSFFGLGLDRYMFNAKMVSSDLIGDMTNIKADIVKNANLEEKITIDKEKMNIDGGGKFFPGFRSNITVGFAF